MGLPLVHMCRRMGIEWVCAAPKCRRSSCSERMVHRERLRISPTPTSPPRPPHINTLILLLPLPLPVRVLLIPTPTRRSSRKIPLLAHTEPMIPLARIRRWARLEKRRRNGARSRAFRHPSVQSHHLRVSVSLSGFPVPISDSNPGPTKRHPHRPRSAHSS